MSDTQRSNISTALTTISKWDWKIRRKIASSAIAFTFLFSVSLLFGDASKTFKDTLDTIENLSLLSIGIILLLSYVFGFVVEVFAILYIRGHSIDVFRAMTICYIQQKRNRYFGIRSKHRRTGTNIIKTIAILINIRTKQRKMKENEHYLISIDKLAFLDGKFQFTRNISTEASSLFRELPDAIKIGLCVPFSYNIEVLFSYLSSIKDERVAIIANQSKSHIDDVSVIVFSFLVGIFIFYFGSLLIAFRDAVAQMSVVGFLVFYFFIAFMTLIVLIVSLYFSYSIVFHHTTAEVRKTFEIWAVLGQETNQGT